MARDEKKKRFIDGRKVRSMRQSRGLERIDVAYMMGWSSTNFLDKIEKNERRISIELGGRLAKILGVTVRDIIDDKFVALIIGEERINYDATLSVPIVGTVAASSRNSFISDMGVSPGARVIGEILLSALSEGAYGALVAGDSMAPRFLDGERLLVDPELPFKNGKYYFVKDRKGHTWAKRVIKRGNFYLLIPEGLHADLIELEEADVEYLHRIRFIELE